MFVFTIMFWKGASIASPDKSVVSCADILFFHAIVSAMLLGCVHGLFLHKWSNLNSFIETHTRGIKESINELDLMPSVAVASARELLEQFKNPVFVSGKDSLNSLQVSMDASQPALIQLNQSGLSDTDGMPLEMQGQIQDTKSRAPSPPRVNGEQTGDVTATYDDKALTSVIQYVTRSHGLADCTRTGWLLSVVISQHIIVDIVLCVYFFATTCNNIVTSSSTSCTNPFGC